MKAKVGLKHKYIQTDIQINSLKDVSALIKTNPHLGIKFSSLNLSRYIHSCRMASGDWSTNVKLLSSQLEAALQMKGRWESNINVWFQFMFSQKWNCATSLYPKQNYKVLAPSFNIYVSVSDLYIPRIGLPILLQPNRQTDPGNILMAHRYMNVWIGNEAAQFHSRNT
jgi:hypothetical protein